MICIGLVALTAWVFRGAIHFQFVNFDDPMYVTNNDRVQLGPTWSNVVWAFTTNHPPYWHPVTWLSHMLDVQMFGLAAGQHHLTNVALHVANSVLLFVWLRRITGHDGRSAFVAALFAVHPLHVESVAWVTERKDLLSGLFWILTLLAYQRYASDRRVLNYALVIVLFVLALMSKPMAVTLPAILLLIDFWPLKRVGPHASLQDWRHLALEKLPLFALAAASAVATVLFQSHVGAVSGLSNVSIAERVAGVGANYVWYLAKMAWPTNLAVFYPLQPVPVLAAVGSWIVVGGLTALTFRMRDVRPSLFVGWMWFVIALLPVIGIIQSGAQAVADRFSYLPSIGILIGLAWSIPLVAAPARRTVSIAAAVIAILAFAVAAELQASTWADSVTLWRQAIQATGGSYLAYDNLGQALGDRGQLGEAVDAYSRALTFLSERDSENRAIAHDHMGLALAQQGALTEALAQFTHAEQASASLADPHLNRANVLAAMSKFPEAEEEFRKALTLAPGTEEAVVGLGSTLLSQGKTPAALDVYRQAIQLNPKRAEAHNGLGAALAMAGNFDAAIAEYTEATRLNPALASAWANLGAALAHQQRFAEAQVAAQRALSINPANESARALLGALSRGGKLPD